VTVVPFRRKRVGVFPRASFLSENRLLASVAQLYPVDFSPEDDISFDGMDAAVFFSDEKKLASRAFEHGVSSFVFHRSSKTIALHPNASVCFSEHNILHPAFRSARIPLGRTSHAAELTAIEGDRTVASYDSLRLWLLRSNGRADLHTVATELPSLDGDRLLWQDLRPDGWFAPLPLLHFMRRLTLGVDWEAAPQHACFIFDDPNLHSVRYGYIDYARLADHARAHKYHAGIATVPLDSWYASPKAVEVFRKHGDNLSLLIHGNDHVKNEFGYDYQEGDAVRILAQAVRRVSRFEHGTGLEVNRVIAPPHGGCSDSVLAQAPRFAIEAVCTSVEPLARSQKRTILPFDFSLQPVWFGPGCCPVVRRWDLIYDLLPLRLGAFFNQPIVAYGHHQDCADGFSRLEKVAGAVNSWGEMNWTNLATILRRSYRVKTDNDVMHVQMCSRHICVPVPEKVSHLVVHIPVESENILGPITATSSDGQTRQCMPGIPVGISSPGELRLRIPSRVVIDPAAVCRPAYRLWPALRRTIAMSRDRLMPIVRAFTSNKSAYDLTHKQMSGLSR